jgi:hypothetical protein
MIDLITCCRSNWSDPVTERYLYLVQCSNLTSLKPEYFILSPQIPKVSDNGKFTYTVVCGVQVELTPPSPGELGAVVRGAGGLVKDALTFRWAQVQIFFI